jgi:hypothetical protein
MPIVNNIPPLILEPCEDNKNLFFLTFIESKNEKFITVIDNMTNSEVVAYVLDNAPAEGVNVSEFMSIATKWYYSASDKYPLSIEMHKLGLAKTTSKIIKVFTMAAISRLVGSTFIFNMYEKPKIRRKKINHPQEGIPIKFKSII